MKKAIKNRDKFLKHVMDTFPFEESGDAGVYYDKGLNAEMTVVGNEVSIEFIKKKEDSSTWLDRWNEENRSGALRKVEEKKG
jgi:hypothetical protein